MPLTVGTPSYPHSRRMSRRREGSLRQVFSSQVACTLPAPYSDERTPDGPRAKGIRGYSVAPLRCNILPQARDIIVNQDRIGLCKCVRMAVRPCTVRCSGYYAPESPTTIVSPHVPHQCHRPEPVSTGNEY